MGKSWTYSYDAGGNITSKREYAYTAGTLGSMLKTYSYTYGNGMKDRLTAWNGKSFAYDSCGNPTKYKGDSMSWQRGRLLSSYTKGGKTYTFNYDINGIRRKKTAGTDSTEYLISDGKLIQQNNYTSGSSTPASKIVFLYSNDGITGCVINNWVYKYEKDISGNVVSLLSGTFQVARYEYDAWGNCKVLNPNGTENTSATFAGNINPIRYRSYYYDSDIGLYYLQTRYYDPETGRFINLDQIEYIDPEQLNGLNLYAYCLNNPVMGYDPMGTFSWKAFGTIFAIVAAAAIGVALTFATGGLAGAVIGGAALGFAVSATDNLISQVSENGWDNVDYGKVWKEGGIGAAIGSVSGFFAYGFGQVASSLGKQIGLSFSHTAHIGSGIKFGNIFGSSTLMTVGSGIGKVGGIISGATFGEFCGNTMFNRDYSIIGNFGKTIKNELSGLIYEFISWGLGF